MLGFEAGGVYVAVGSHLLRVEFVGASRVSPVSDQPPPDGHSNPDRFGLEDQVGLAGAPPLGKVSYPDLWPGIGLTYEFFEGGIAKSTYLVAHGAKVEGIRLRYNVPAELADDGSLTFDFATGEMR